VPGRRRSGFALAPPSLVLPRAGSSCDVVVHGEAQEDGASRPGEVHPSREDGQREADGQGDPQSDTRSRSASSAAPCPQGSGDDMCLASEDTLAADSGRGEAFCGGASPEAHRL